MRIQPNVIDRPIDPKFPGLKKSPIEMLHFFPGSRKSYCCLRVFLREIGVRIIPHGQFPPSIRSGLGLGLGWEFSGGRGVGGN